MNQLRPALTIDLILDPVCPWCYIGFRGLDWALMGLSFQYTLSVRFRPYQINPDTPATGIDRESVLARKFPDLETRKAIGDALEHAMTDVGLSFDPATPKWLPDTTDAHRLIRWGDESGAAREVAAALFEAYWQHGEDIGQHEVLFQVAESAGLDPEEISERLASSEDKDAIRQEAAELRGGGLKGVPGFIVNEVAGFEGALPKADLLAALKQLAEETS